MGKVDRVYFKLYRSRLARYCLYFDKLFADETADYERWCATVEDCPVYHVPAELAADDFERLLTVLETPLYVHVLVTLFVCTQLKPPSQNIFEHASDAKLRDIPSARRPERIMRGRLQAR